MRLLCFVSGAQPSRNDDDSFFQCPSRSLVLLTHISLFDVKNPTQPLHIPSYSAPQFMRAPRFIQNAKLAHNRKSATHWLIIILTMCELLMHVWWRQKSTPLTLTHRVTNTHSQAKIISPNVHWSSENKLLNIAHALPLRKCLCTSSSNNQCQCRMHNLTISLVLIKVPQSTRN